jgi:dihydropteroate synthase
MGILNITPDSFSDGGCFSDPEDALRQADRMIGEGADIIDLGAESTRPGYATVSPEEEWSRLEPVLGPLLIRCPVPVSIDTQKAWVAEQALSAGAHIINDIWGLQKDPAMAETAARYGAAVVVMHNQEEAPSAEFLSAEFPSAGSQMEEMVAFFEKSFDIARSKGLPKSSLIVDPGIGFGKNTEQNLDVLGNLSRLRSLECPILLGVSRKSVIRNTLELEQPWAETALSPTISLNVLGLAMGATIFRVHDVGENKRALRMAQAVLGRSSDNV